MKSILSFGTLISACLAALVCAGSGASQNIEPKKNTILPKHPVIISEIKTSKRAGHDAPDECLRTFRKFFNYIQQSEPDIAGDPKAQIRWLSSGMRKAVLEKQNFEDQQAKENPTDKREYPGNGSFVGAWDYPTSYEIVGSRLYGETATIDVLYKWGNKTQYPGSKRLSSFIFVKEDKLWKLQDVYTFDGIYNSAESLINYFRQAGGRN